MPVGNNPDKNAAMRAFGANVVEIGKDFDDAREWVEQEAPQRGLRYVHSANEPLLIAGVGTYGLEIFEALPDVDTILVPLGGGNDLPVMKVRATVAQPELVGRQPLRSPRCRDVGTDEDPRELLRVGAGVHPHRTPHGPRDGGGELEAPQPRSARMVQAHRERRPATRDHPGLLDLDLGERSG